MTSVADGVLSELGMFSYLEGIEECFNTGRTLTGKSSCISAKPTSLRPNTRTLIIDCGGTNTRITEHSVTREGVEQFTPIALRVNAEFKLSERGDIFANFCTEIFKIAKEAASGHFDGIALVWSNDFEPHRFERDGCRGVTGIVQNKGNGTSYRKGESFLVPLKDGDDLAAFFLDAARNQGIAPQAFVTINDTIAVACVTQNASSGLVLSSGGNATSVADEQFVNLEAGAHIVLPVSCLTNAERIAHKDRLTIEQAAAGKWIASLFLLNLSYAPHHVPVPNSITAKDLGAYLKSDDSIVAGIASAICDRAAKLCGVMGAVSLASQLENKDWTSEVPKTVNLDSRIAEGLPGFLTTAGITLNTLLGRSKPARFNLLREDPRAQSIPVQGAARAIHQFY